ncbi:hypothetical protein AGIG_G2301 [Arapaima gigas]
MEAAGRAVGEALSVFPCLLSPPSCPHATVSALSHRFICLLCLRCLRTGQRALRSVPRRRQLPSASPSSRLFQELV